MFIPVSVSFVPTTAIQAAPPPSHSPPSRFPRPSHPSPLLRPPSRPTRRARPLVPLSPTRTPIPIPITSPIPAPIAPSPPAPPPTAAPIPASRPAPRSTYEYNQLIKRISRRKGQLSRCLSLLSDLRSAGLQPDKYTYSLLLSACARAKATTIALELHASLCAESIPLDNHIRSSLLTLAANNVPPRLDICHRLFSEAQPTLHLCNTMLDALAQAAALDACLAVFRHMRSSHISPDGYTATALIRAYVTAGHVDEALVQLHHMHDAGWHIPSHAFGILMDAFGKRRRVDRALDVFDTMTLWRVPPTQVSYNILISACAVAALPARAVEIFDEMRHTAGLLGDRYTFHALMKAYLKVGDASNVLHYYRLVRKSPFQCNQVSYRYALIASGRGMDIDAVHEVAADMKLAECHPREDTAAALVAAAIRCSDLQSALSFFSSFVSGTKPPKVRSFFSAIRGALKSCEVPSGERNDNSDFKFTSRVVDELERSWRFGR